jgi:hypothetical protein
VCALIDEVDENGSIYLIKGGAALLQNRFRSKSSSFAMTAAASTVSKKSTMFAR